MASPSTTRVTSTCCSGTPAYRTAEEAFASAYSVQVSSDGVNWETVFDTATGDGGVGNLSVAWSLGRYLRIVCIDRATEWGFSLWDIEVYGN